MDDPRDVALRWSIEDLLDDGEIDSTTPAYGVAQQVVRQGYDSLDTTQKAIYDRVLALALKQRAEALEISRLETNNLDPG